MHLRTLACSDHPSNSSKSGEEISEPGSFVLR